MKADYLSRKEKIVLTTISLIHEMGVNNVSMKEIGNREGVTDASLYKHFKNKEELLKAVMEYYEQYDSLIYKTLENSEESAADNIFKYFTIYAEYYSSYKEITSLINAYDVLAYDHNFSDRAGILIEQKTEFIMGFVKKGQEELELSKEIRAESLTYVLLGSFDRIIAMWRLDHYNFSLRDKTVEIIGDILTAFKTLQTAAAEEKKVKI